MIIGITGHRSPRIPNMQYVRTQLQHAFTDLKAERVLQGMCEGVDLVAAKTAYDLNIPYWAVIPWKGQKPPPEVQTMWLNAKIYSEKVVYVSDSEYYTGPHLFHDRNHYLVDNSDTMVAVWDGKKKGGTWQTIKYAVEHERPVWLIKVDTMEVGWLTDLPE